MKEMENQKVSVMCANIKIINEKLHKKKLKKKS